MLIVIAIILFLILLAQLAPDLVRHIIVYSLMALVALVIIGIFIGIGAYFYNYQNDWFNVVCLASLLIVGIGAIINLLEA